MTRDVSKEGLVFTHTADLILNLKALHFNRYYIEFNPFNILTFLRKPTLCAVTENLMKEVSFKYASFEGNSINLKW